MATEWQYLSRHFTLAELTKTSSKLSNVPTLAVISSLRDVCANILEPVRDHFQRPIIVHSGYRSSAVNADVGGSKQSQHKNGEAVDFHVSGYSVFEAAIWISENIEFDQLILENFIPNIKRSGWVHCSFSKRSRNQELTKFKGSHEYHPGIILGIIKMDVE